MRESEVAVALPEASVRKAVFSTQTVPFHLRVVLVTVPEAIALGINTVVHLVVVPVDSRSCPAVPVAPTESVSAPLIVTLKRVAAEPTIKFEVEAVAAYNMPEIVSLVVEALLRNVRPETVKLVEDALARVA